VYSVFIYNINIRTLSQAANCFRGYFRESFKGICERSERCAYASASKNTTIIIVTYKKGVASILSFMYINSKRVGEVY